MELSSFIEKRTYLYHLTDRRNINFISSSKILFATTQLAKMSALNDKKQYLTTRRDQHSCLEIDGNIVFVRDQKPITKALDRCLTDGMNRGDFINF